MQLSPTTSSLASSWNIAIHNLAIPTPVVERIARGRGRPRREAVDDRAEQMAHQFSLGATLQEIGDEYGITRERVRQILTSIGVGRHDGGQSVKTLANLRYKNKPKPDKHFATYGCTKAEAELLNGGLCVSTKRTPAHKYGNQRRNAKARGIAWEITFPEWLNVWLESGHFQERGRGVGYVMARIGDVGAYAVDNVEIITSAQNISDSYISRPWSSRNIKIKTHCVHGHARTPDNVISNGTCRTCVLALKKKLRSLILPKPCDSLRRACSLIGSINFTAEILNISASRLSHWRAGTESLPSGYCPAIERATEGAVTCEELRPDVSWVRVPDAAWPHPQGRPLVDHAAKVGTGDTAKEAA